MKITIELNAVEAGKALSTGSLALLIKDAEGGSDPVVQAQPVQAPVVQAQPVQAPVVQAQPVQAIIDTEKLLEQIKSVLGPKMMQGKAVEITAMFNAHGANNLSSIPSHELPAVLIEAQAI